MQVLSDINYRRFCYTQIHLTAGCFMESSQFRWTCCSGLSVWSWFVHSQKPVCCNGHLNNFTIDILISPYIEVSQVICADSTGTFY